MAPESAWLKAAFLVFGLEVNLLGPTAIDLAERIGVVEADLGVVFMVNGLISILGAAPSGWMTDHLPGHTLLGISLAIQAAGLAFVGRQTSLAGVAAVFGTVAASWNIHNCAGNVLAIQQTPQGRSALMVNLVNALFGLGALCAPLLAEACDRALGSTLLAFPVTAALAALSALVFLALPSPPTPKQLAAAAAAAAADAEAAAVPLLAAEGGGGSSGAEGGGGEEPGATKPAAGGGAEDAWSLRGPLLHVLLPAAAFVFLSVGLEVGFGGWTTVYGTRYLGESESAGHALTSAYWGAFTAGRIAASAAAAVAPPATLLLASMPLAVAGAAAALALPPAVLAGWPATVCVVLVGLGLSTGFANLLALLEVHAPINGSVTGLLGGCAGAGTMLVPLAVAVLAKSTPLGFQGLMWTTLAAMVAQFACLAPILAAGRARGEGRGGGAAAQDVPLPAAAAAEGGAAAAAAGGSSGQGGHTA
ncbi:MFS transporter [Raphidocelis subcapitata]|uniref:MFS transporter n=1 Tax=Raphidocelis subcapitata TaxID=307507 RepID=A0A2V0PBW4_9CHLO|nr:MFS transporter [Raphidocelis subcapitata]|eukprot:GBF95370.1 MFS transporter [Raphidocelis subcapitata]